MDRGETIYNFAEEFLVVCPGCAGCARVVPREPGRAAPFDPRRLVCGGCGLVREWESHGIEYRAGQDWYFHLPLWLSAPCCGETLWAHNPRHLEFIEEYVSAALRENRRTGEPGWSSRSLANRLPAWLKEAKNRDEVLKVIARLKRSSG